MDKNIKIFGKINIIDFVALVFLLAVAAALVYRFAAPSANVSSDNTSVTYVVKISGVRPLQLPYYTIEDSLQCFDSKTNEFIGTIKEVHYSPFKVEISYDDGTIKKVDHPLTIDIYLTIEANGRITRNAVYVNGTYKLRLGTEIILETKYNSISTTLVKLNGKSIVLDDEIIYTKYERILVD